MFEEKCILHTENRFLGYVQTGGVYIRARGYQTHTEGNRRNGEIGAEVVHVRGTKYNKQQ